MAWSHVFHELGRSISRAGFSGLMRTFRVVGVSHSSHRFRPFPPNSHSGARILTLPLCLVGPKGEAASARLARSLKLAKSPRVIPRYFLDKRKSRMDLRPRSQFVALHGGDSAKLQCCLPLWQATTIRGMNPVNGAELSP
jgi:hypothetical protein